jgi:beta-glucanase (GH16 family)
MKKTRKLSVRRQLKSIYIIPLILAIIALGIGLKLTSHAATNVVAFEAESGALTAGAKTVANSTASGQSAVKFALSSASPSPTATPPVAGTKCPGLVNLKFCDDFDGAAGTAPDSSKWHVLTGSSWGGQCFRDSRDNIATDGQGNMKFTLINKGASQCNDSTGNATSITSGGMDTQGKENFHYGLYEIRAKLACAQSVWGAIWMSTGSGPSWPQSGEIDIYEQFNNQQNVLTQTIHAGNPPYQKGTTFSLTNPLCQDYHVYGMDWRAGSIQFMLDGKPTNKIVQADVAGKPWPFDTYDLRMLLDLQYGGSGWPYPGAYNITQLPSSMLIDYIHIFD